MSIVRSPFLWGLIAITIATLLAVTPAMAAGDAVPTPKEHGVYAKTATGLKRILPNMVSDEQGIYYLETNKPQRFALGTIEYFIIFGNYRIEYLTLNPMKPFQMTPLGIPRMMFGKDIEMTVTKKGEGLYTVKPKGLFGRDYYALWIEDTAWDFVVE
jgi:hypothetical protein